MSESPLADREVREAVLVLRDAGITAEQYRDLDVTEHWSVSGLEGDFPDRESALAAARTTAVDSGEEAEVRRRYGFDSDGGALEYVVKPDGKTWLP